MEAFEKIQLAFKCPKALDDLQPCQNNWYCDSCQNMVYDFRGMAEEEILATFAKSGQQLCGIYDTERIKGLPQKPKWYKWIPAAMIVFGVSACHDKEVYLLKPAHVEQKQMIDSATITENSFVGFMSVSINPEFPGGETAWSKYITEQLTHTGAYRGRVFAQFTVERDGTLTNINIIKGGDAQVNEKIITVLKNSPRWRPGIQNDKPIATQYTLPFNFTTSN